MRSKIVVVVLGVIVAIIGIGVGVGLLAGHGHVQLPPDQAQAPDNSASQAATAHHAPTQTPNPAPPVAPLTSTQSVAAVQPTNVAAATNPTLTDTNWEEKIDDIVGSDEPDTNKVKQLFALFPKLPADGQEEAAQHLSNLVDDEDYGPLGDLLKNDKLPEGVLDELLADLLNRPNSLKLNTLLQVAENSNHIKHDEAKDLLELYLGDDYGTDWSVWNQKLTAWLKENPD